MSSHPAGPAAGSLPLSVVRSSCHIIRSEEAVSPSFQRRLLAAAADVAASPSSPSQRWNYGSVLRATRSLRPSSSCGYGAVSAPTEVGAVHPRPVEDDAKLARQGDTPLLGAAPLRHPHRPALERGHAHGRSYPRVRRGYRAGSSLRSTLRALMAGRRMAAIGD